MIGESHQLHDTLGYHCRFLLSCKVHYDPAHCPPSVNLSECDPSQGKMSRRRPMIASVVLWHSPVWHRPVWHRLVWHRHILPVHTSILRHWLTTPYLNLIWHCRKFEYQQYIGAVAVQLTYTIDAWQESSLVFPPFLIQPALKWREFRWWHSTCGAPSTH